MAQPTRNDANVSDPRQAGVGGAGVGTDQVLPAETVGSSTGDVPDRGNDLTGGDEINSPGADAGVTSGSRATGTGANLGETEAIRPASPP